MRFLYTIVLVEKINASGCFEREFNFYQGDLLLYFFHFNHVDDHRFCEIPNKRRQAVYCGMQWIGDDEFPIKYPFKMISGDYLHKGPICIMKAGSKKLKFNDYSSNVVSTTVNVNDHFAISNAKYLNSRKEYKNTDPFYLKKSEKQKLSMPPLKPIRTLVYERDNFTCVCCGEKMFSLLTLDHITPKSKGGKFTVDNLQTMCQRCNNAKGNLRISVETLRELIML